MFKGSFSEENNNDPHFNERMEEIMMKRLYRSSSDRMVSGVLGGIAAYLNVDSAVVRLLFVLGLFFTVFTLAFGYIAAVFIMPDEREMF
jgi:phage shock protein C